MFMLSPLGTVHTVISLVALLTGAFALLRYGKITPDRISGWTYVATTALTCLTGFGIFEHGGFGKPHALGVLTLIVLGVAIAARATSVFGRRGPLIEMACYSTTYFLHLIPGITETFTRIPAGSAVFRDADDPALAKVIGVVFVVFIVALVVQIRRELRRADASPYLNGPRAVRP